MDRKDVVVEKLERVRKELLGLVGEIEAEQWDQNVYSESAEWRVSDLLRHVVSAEQGMTRLIENIRDGGSGSPPDFDLTRWNATRVKKSRNKSVADLTADMANNRANLFEVIETLQEEDLDKEGLHPSMEVMTIEGILHRIADHEEHHMGDIRRAVS